MSACDRERAEQAEAWLAAAKRASRARARNKTIKHNRDREAWEQERAELLARLAEIETGDLSIAIQEREAARDAFRALHAEYGLRVAELEAARKRAAGWRQSYLDLRRAPHGEIEVCERAMDRRPDGGPKYHAKLKGKKGVWAAGDTPDDAIGNLVRCHPKQFGVVITTLPGRHPR